MTRDELKQLAQDALDGKHGEIGYCERELARGVLKLFDALVVTISIAQVALQAKNLYISRIEHPDRTGE